MTAERQSAGNAGGAKVCTDMGVIVGRAICSQERGELVLTTFQLVSEVLLGHSEDLTKQVGDVLLIFDLL